MKIDVETNLPPKKEYVLYAPLSVRQRDAYDHVLNGGVRQWLIQGGAGNAEAIVTKVEANNEEDPIVIEDSDEDEEEDVPLAKAQTDKREKEKEAKKPRTSDRRVKGGRKSYAVDVDDDEYFEMVERGEFDERGLLKTVLSQEEQAAEDVRVGQEYHKRMKGKLFFVTSCLWPRLIQCDAFLSPSGEQYEAAKHGHAAPQSLLASVPVRVADGPQDVRPCHWRGACLRQWQDDGPGPPAEGVVQAQAQGSALQSVHDDVGYYRGQFARSSAESAELHLIIPCNRSRSGL